MKAEERRIGGTDCRIYVPEEAPAAILVQPADDNDLELMDSEAAWIEAHTDVPFLLAAFRIRDWNEQLSPWPAPPVFGKNGFGDGAPKTLDYVLQQLLPALDAAWPAANGQQERPVLLGGYSLAGLFALWAATKTDRFAGINGASPSVWFPGWPAYVSRDPIRSRCIYLSLGDAEERTRSPQMRQVGDNIRELAAALKQQPQTESVLEWNEGNHFRDSDVRSAKGFVWTLEHVKY